MDAAESWLFPWEDYYVDYYEEEDDYMDSEEEDHYEDSEKEEQTLEFSWVRAMYLRELSWDAYRAAGTDEISQKPLSTSGQTRRTASMSEVMSRREKEACPPEWCRKAIRRGPPPKFSAVPQQARPAERAVSTPELPPVVRRRWLSRAG